MFASIGLFNFFFNNFIVILEDSINSVEYHAG